MMAIIKKVKRDGKRVTVTLAGEGPDETLCLGATLWEGLGLAEGDLPDRESEEKLRRASALSETVTDAMRIAAGSPHSVSALVMKLTRRGHAKEDAVRAVRACSPTRALPRSSTRRKTPATRRGAYSEERKEGPRGYTRICSQRAIPPPPRRTPRTESRKKNTKRR